MKYKIGDKVITFYYRHSLETPQLCQSGVIASKDQDFYFLRADDNELHSIQVIKENNHLKINKYNFLIPVDTPKEEYDRMVAIKESIEAWK